VHHESAQSLTIENSKPETWFPEVTVVVPAYNSAATISPCIESLLAQDYPPERYEIIVVDNNSTDETAALVEEYPVQLVFETAIQTPGAARNRGLGLSAAEITAFIDSDCIAAKDWLRSLVRPFQDPAVGVVGCRIDSQIADSGLVEAFLAQVNIITEEHFPPLEPKGFPAGAVAYRRSALDRVGSFDIFMQASEDVDLAWRVQAYGGYKGVYVAEAVVYNKHRSTLAGMFHQFRRYGFSGIVLATRYRGETFHRRTPASQLRLMARQARALATFSLSFVVRLLRWRRWRRDRMYLAWPILWFVLESGNLIGKLQALVVTRGFRHDPIPSQLETEMGSVNRLGVA
jgi:cellulose synthase/poly-beta-1,6-N-acetylglucosamine synthase-like glycosyltransferase